MSLSFNDAVAYLDSLQKLGWKLGLERMHEFVQRAGILLNENYIQVAGTNGKGSVTAHLQSLLVEQGYRTGAYYSPYVYSLRERVQIGRAHISEGEFAACVEHLQPLADELGITEFEMKTAIGFLAWQRAHCEWVALEVGLGGRLDATSVVTPRCGVIVSIGLDHTQILGDTLELIAIEKAGIIKPGMPLVLGQMPSKTVEEVILERAAGSTVWRYGKEIFFKAETLVTPNSEFHGLRSGLTGEIQKQNMALAVAALELSGARSSPERVQLGAIRTCLPGRMEHRTFRGHDVLLDGAHNTEAAEVLTQQLPKGRKIVLVANLLVGHDPVPFFEQFAGKVSQVIVPPIDFFRAVPPQEMVAKIANLFDQVEAVASVESAMDLAAHSSKEALIVVTGSFYLVGEVGNWLTHELSRQSQHRE